MTDKKEKFMKRLTALCFATFILMVSDFGTGVQATQIQSISGAIESALFVQEADIHGYFSIKGKVPQGFADIEHINLGGNGEYGAKANPPYYGLIRAKKDYHLLKPTMDGKNFSFKTKAVAGVSYEFEGAFTRLDFTEEDKQPVDIGKYDETVLSGTLKKMKAGKMIAESKVDFSWELGD
jgi:hypothetical protein